MNEFQYILEKGSKKRLCPSCGKKRFVQYIDIETGELLPDQYGKCDRLDNCGYHLNPYVDGYATDQRGRRRYLFFKFSDVGCFEYLSHSPFIVSSKNFSSSIQSIHRPSSMRISFERSEQQVHVPSVSSNFELGCFFFHSLILLWCCCYCG